MKKIIQILLFSSLIISCQEPIRIELDTKLENVKIQPKEALALANDEIEKNYHLNKDNLNSNNPNLDLKIHITKKGEWYYFKKTNYPAMSNSFYLEKAVMVNSNTGEIKLSK
ncbi:hypothetical protein [Aureivirga sp. CE67]|uniref:hypothetical protein n=1 Tax=Aureivirga sp. CE67 TaxID=1788983 RepID=UPI0018CB12D5|nr:hypothetical protein [Aureivirga sp. CE67]